MQRKGQERQVNTVKIITIAAHRRPGYTAQVLKALRRCDGYGDYHLIASVDGPDDGEAQQETAKLLEHRCKILIRRKYNLGNSGNTIGLLLEGFRWSNFVVHLEDDTVPARDFLTYMEWANKKFSESSDVFSIGAFNREYPTEKNMFQVKATHGFCCWGVGLWREKFWTLLAHNGWPKRSNYDTYVDSYCREEGLFQILPCASRCLNIGQYEGANVTPADWHKMHRLDWWACGVSNESKEYELVGDIKP